jgi:hypothetical protein
MRLCVKNGAKPILPPSVGFLNEEQKAAYKSIFDAQDYKIDDPIQSTKMEIDVGGQISLHMHTLKEFAERGFQIKAIDQHGKEREVSFAYLDGIFSDPNADEKLQAKIEDIRSKRRKRRASE